jgi:hypothetical protein
MKSIRPLARPGLAAVLLAVAGLAAAQGFSSVSSQPPAQRPVPPAASTTPVTPAAVATPAAASIATAFTSVSSLGPDGSLPASGAGPQLPGVPVAERIVIEKRTRRLLLMNGGEVIAVYPVKLGLSPVGHKQYEGDFRTPEGSYRLTRRNAESDFFLAVQVSYPEATDIAIARKNGWAPGGLIMVHGLPNFPKYPRDRYLSSDWTDGCIALSNEDMLDFWLLTGQGTPIEIRP